MTVQKEQNNALLMIWPIRFYISTARSRTDSVFKTLYIGGDDYLSIFAYLKEN